jgi:hypothetical protein
MEDPRCCGTGTCIINEEGLCWCGQRWNGERMCFPEPAAAQSDERGEAPPRASASPAPGAPTND